jgi:hypothetical protein
MCKKKVNWYCPTCDETTVCFGAYFVKLHNTSIHIICKFSWGVGGMWGGVDQCYEY